MYTVMFIDERPEALDDFMDYIDAMTPTKKSIRPITTLPLSSLSEMIQYIASVNPDALIVDYQLNDEIKHLGYNVPYTGTQLINEIQSIRENFPCFVLTSFDDRAISESEDVNMVYVKGILEADEQHSLQARATFIEKIEKQIEHYRARIDKVKNRLDELRELMRTGKATLSDEEELVELDSFLEKALDRTSAIPKDLKRISSSKRLCSLIAKADEIFELIKKG